jgi:hypothetical protein
LNPERSILLPTSFGKEFYDGDWIFLTFYSQTGCSLTMNVVFKDEERADVKKKIKEVQDYN